MKRDSMVKWPCIFKLTGEDELMFFPSESVLIEELAPMMFSDEDILVDSNGTIFNVVIEQDKNVSYTLLGNTLSIEEVTKLIQAHEFSKAETCLTKIHFRSIADAIAALSI